MNSLEKKHYDLYPAMFRWFRNNFKDSPEEGAAYIYQALMSGPKDSVFWELMSAANGGTWKASPESFENTSKAIIELAEKID